MIYDLLLITATSDGNECQHYLAVSIFPICLLPKMPACITELDPPLFI